MGELICTVIGLLFLFGSFSIFMSIITEKDYDTPVNDNVTDLVIAKELTEHITEDELFVDEDLLED
tara:strand:- start:247 stop:444 length:198 start_codon:yes stop_codon:yes gene_type:complete